MTHTQRSSDSMAHEETYWIRTQRDKTHYQYTCTNCHNSNRHHKYTFCPYCGKRMVTDVVLNAKGDVI